MRMLCGLKHRQEHYPQKPGIPVRKDRQIKCLSWEVSGILNKPETENAQEGGWNRSSLMGNVKEMQSQPKELPQPEGEQFEQQDKVVLDYKLGWSWNSNTLANWCGELTHLKRPWCWERLKAEGEGDDRGWDGWKALPTGWTWVWVSSGSWWWTGKPGVQQSMGSQRVRHDWATELNWTEYF